MIFSPSRKSEIMPVPTICNSPLELVTTFKFLGFNICSTLSWDSHCSSILNKFTSYLLTPHRLQSFLPIFQLLRSSFHLIWCLSLRLLKIICSKYIDCGRAILGKSKTSHTSSSTILQILDWPDLDNILFFQ